MQSSFAFRFETNDYLGTGLQSGGNGRCKSSPRSPRESGRAMIPALHAAVAIMVIVSLALAVDFVIKGKRK